MMPTTHDNTIQYNSYNTTHYTNTIAADGLLLHMYLCMYVCMYIYIYIYIYIYVQPARPDCANSYYVNQA